VNIFKVNCLFPTEQSVAPIYVRAETEEDAAFVVCTVYNNVIIDYVKLQPTATDSIQLERLWYTFCLDSDPKFELAENRELIDDMVDAINKLCYSDSTTKRDDLISIGVPVNYADQFITNICTSNYYVNRQYIVMEFTRE